MAPVEQFWNFIFDITLVIRVHRVSFARCLQFPRTFSGDHEARRLAQGCVDIIFAVLCAVPHGCACT